MAAEMIRNGVNLDQLTQTVQAIQQNPELARFQFRAVNTWEHGGQSTTRVESLYGAGDERPHAHVHTLVGDEPAVLLGSDTGANAVETVLAGLGACLAVGFAYNAAARGIDIEALEFEMEGDLDLHAFLGLSQDTRPGYQDIRVRYRVESSAPREKILELCDYVQRTSPVLDILQNPVPVTIDIAD